MDQFIVSSKTISYLSSKHMFDADAASDDKPYKILFVLCLKQISKKFRFFIITFRTWFLTVLSISSSI